jgi:hypothetical protein
VREVGSNAGNGNYHCNLCLSGSRIHCTELPILALPVDPKYEPGSVCDDGGALGRTLLISDLHLRMKGRFQFAGDLRRVIRANDTANVVFVGRSSSSKEFSFIDCTSIAVCRARKIPNVATFD